MGSRSAHRVFGSASTFQCPALAEKTAAKPVGERDGVLEGRKGLQQGQGTIPAPARGVESSRMKERLWGTGERMPKGPLAGG